MRHLAHAHDMKSLEQVRLAQRVATDGMALPNGGARNVSPSAWMHVLDQLSQDEWPTTWPEAGGRRPQRLDDLADDAFALARVQVGPSVLVHLYPSWGTDDLWFDFDARELQHQPDADALSDFIRMLGQTVGRPVELSYEGRDEEVFATYAPDSDEFDWSDDS
jgi:hypothetical protein